ncbi:S41 family peptidase [Agromyces archimandritae]|uniref:Tricorn protease homolog n=1 Tax=Agromyces archimandritae TaxID=2781962 RepID=A0A975FNI4_9MICO|nr:S41 family peptidase [Agromyces archimandritae]QTX05685.1 PDZ domain-containing protein [Agromyces archimandritae]
MPLFPVSAAPPIVVPVTPTTTYVRFPHLHEDRLAFIADDDVWIAPVAGGTATRLTNDRAPARTPRFSPDGRWIAYISHRDGHPEVFVVDAAGGESRRLSWWGASATVLLGWTADGRVLAGTNAGQLLRDTVVHAVGLDGRVERMPYGPAWGLARRDDGAVALVTPGSRPPAWWKRYRGGTAPRLWLDASGEGSWSRLLPEDAASVVDPMWVDGRLVFVSDRAAVFPDRADEQANLWVWEGEPGAGEPRQLTRQGPDLGYVRDASTDGRRIVWHSRGRVWMLDRLDGEPRPIELALPGVRPRSFLVKAAEQLNAIAPDHGADGSLMGVRGAVYWVTHRDGPARALVADSAVRVREPQLLGRTGLAVWVTDAAGEDALEVRPLTGDVALEVRPLTGDAAPRLLAEGRLGRVLHLAADPAGGRVAVITHDGRILLVAVADGAITEIGVSGDGEAMHPSFSPDGRYLLWTQPAPQAEMDPQRLMIADLAAAEPAPIALTSGIVHDHSPAFTRDGKHIVFLSNRTFDPIYDEQSFDLAFTGSTRPWLLPISAAEPAPFGPSVEGWRLSAAPGAPGGAGAAGASGAASGADADAPPASPELDVEGAEDRILPFPVPSDAYRELRAADGGVLWVREAGDAGVIGSRRPQFGADPAPDTLEFWSFAERRVIRVADRVDEYAVSGDGTRVVVRTKQDVTVQPAGRKPAEDSGEAVKVDLSRIRLEVDPAAERRQMFDENARLMRDHYWRADMNGVDWEAVAGRWRPVVDAVATHDDLVDLLWETVAELNTSHAYIQPKLPLGDASRRIGLLGADLSPADGGWRIDRILPGLTTDPEARSPLRAAGVDAAPGDLIVAVDGVPVDPAFGPAAALTGAAGKPVELTLRSGSPGSSLAAGTDRRVVVVPLDDEEVLRYQDWVRSRREYVREHSGGRLGYVHVPDMQSKGWAQLHRDLRTASRAEGLIADVRYNRGGHTSQLVISALAAEVIGWNRARHYETAFTYPEVARRGPLVLVANEYSGSDGDIVNAAAQALGLGPVVGVRTWGGVVGIDGRYRLVDGTGVTQPRYSYWFEGKEWGVENHGVDPDIEVVHTPGDYFTAADPQLDRAIAEALARLDAAPAKQPPPMPAPRVRAE